MENAVQGLSVFQRIYNNTVVRFFLSAGIAFIADILIYFITINYVEAQQNVMIFSYRAEVHEFSLLVSYSCGVLINFLITKYAVFSESTVASRRQFFRFALIAFVGFFANYILLRFLIEYLNFYPTLARIISALSLGVASFYIHKFFTFKIKK